MQIIIVGCGNVGATLTEQLSQEGHNITVIDMDAQRAESVANRFDVMGVVGNGASFNVQNEAGIEDADLLIAVNRSYGKSDYIPCICWGRNARFASGFEVGGHVEIWGRIQSREYVKKISENMTEKRVAYEVSVSKVERLE